MNKKTTLSPPPLTYKNSSHHDLVTLSLQSMCGDVFVTFVEVRQENFLWFLQKTSLMTRTLDTTRI